MPALEDRVDADLLLSLEPLVEFFTWYFSAEVRGIEHVPSGPALFVGNHSGHVMTPDTWLFGRAFYRHTRFEEPLVALAHKMVFRTPYFGELATRAGAVEATRDNAYAALRQGCKVLVYPGGGWEAARPFTERDRIDFKGRLGFLRIAARTHVPIVPVVAAGAHDGFVVLSRGERLAELLRLTNLKLDTFPIALGFPFGLVVGPFAPYLPRRCKILVEVLPPVTLNVAPDLPDDEEEPLRAEYDRITGIMQSALTRLASELPGRN